MFEELYERGLNEFDMVVNPFLNSDLCLLTEDNFPEYLKVDSKVIKDGWMSKIEDERNHSYTEYVNKNDKTEFISEIFLNDMTLKCSHELSDKGDILRIIYIPKNDTAKKVSSIVYNKTTDKIFVLGNIRKRFGETDMEKKSFTLRALEYITSSTRTFTLENIQDDGYPKVQYASAR